MRSRGLMPSAFRPSTSCCSVTASGTKARSLFFWFTLIEVLGVTCVVPWLSGEGWLTVASTLSPEEPSTWRVSEDRPLTDLLSSEPLGRLGALMAVDGDGVLQGVVTIEQVRRALQSAFGSPTA